VAPATQFQLKVGVLVPMVFFGEIKVALPGKVVDVQTVKDIGSLHCFSPQLQVLILQL